MSGESRWKYSRPCFFRLTITIETNIKNGESALNITKNLKLVMWDLDGTMLDSRKAHFEAVQKVFKNHGLLFPMEGSGSFFGQTTGHIFNQVIGNSRSPEYIQKMLQEKEVVFRELIQSNAELLPGVGHWLNEINQAGIQQVIVSSTNKESIIATVEALKVDIYLTEIFSGEHLPSKPDPAVFSAAMEERGMEAQSCLVFEDSPHGIQAAKSIGLKCIASAITFPKNELAEADLVVETLEQLHWKDINHLFG